MRKFFYVILILIIIGGCIFAWFHFIKNIPATGPVPTASLPQPSLSKSSSSSSAMPISYSIADTFPKTDTISIGTGNGSIDVKNFYKTLVDTEEGSIIMADNADYQISYVRTTSIFYIHFKNATVAQSTAESELINILGISQQDACNLNILVFPAGKQEGNRPSFCP